MNALAERNRRAPVSVENGDRESRAAEMPARVRADALPDTETELLATIHLAYRACLGAASDLGSSELPHGLLPVHERSWTRRSRPRA